MANLEGTVQIACMNNVGWEPNNDVQNAELAIIKFWMAIKWLKPELGIASAVNPSLPLAKR